MLRKRLKGHRGQSIVEYLVIVTVVVIAIFAVRTAVQGHMTNLFNSAANHTGNAATQLRNLKTEQ